MSDPDYPEDVLKTDADENGQGGDDAYDMWRYGLASRPLAPKVLPVSIAHVPDRAPPLDWKKGRVSPRLSGQQMLDRELGKRSPITQRVPIRHKVGR